MTHELQASYRKLPNTSEATPEAPVAKPNNSLDFVIAALPNLPPSVAQLCHDLIFTQTQYQIPKAVVLTWGEWIVSGLKAIFKCGYQEMQNRNFHDALFRGDIKSAENAIRCGADVTSTSAYDLLQHGQIEAAGFLMRQPKNHSMRAGLFQRGLQEALNRPEMRRSAIHVVLLAYSNDMQVLSNYFYATLSQGDYDTAQLFFDYGFTCEQLITQANGALFNIPTLEFLKRNGFSFEMRFSYTEVWQSSHTWRNGTTEYYTERETSHTNFVWECAQMNDTPLMKWILDELTPEQKTRLLSTACKRSRHHERTIPFPPKQEAPEIREPTEEELQDQQLYVRALRAQVGAFNAGYRNTWEYSVKIARENPDLFN